MGFFGGIKDQYKKAEAAVVVQNLLEHQAKFGMFELDPVRYANLLVRFAWQQKPDIFSGKFGQRPYKLSVAAVALAHGAARLEAGNINRPAVLLALGNVLAEIERNGRLYPLNSLDEFLLESATAAYLEAAVGMEA